MCVWVCVCVCVCVCVQFHRMVMFTRLLESYPHSRTGLLAEAVVDVCPLVRAEVWATLLGVKVHPTHSHTRTKF